MRTQSSLTDRRQGAVWFSDRRLGSLRLDVRLLSRAVRIRLLAAKERHRFFRAPTSMAANLYGRLSPDVWTKATDRSTAGQYTDRAYSRRFAYGPSHLRYFVAVAEAGQMTRAAEAFAFNSPRCHSRSRDGRAGHPRAVAARCTRGYPRRRRLRGRAHAA